MCLRCQTGLRHIHMLNLVIADTAFITLPSFQDLRCFFSACLRHPCVLIKIHFVNMYASILMMTAISVQRYLVIRFPKPARSGRRFAHLVLLVTLHAVVQNKNDPEKLWTCYERCKDHRLQLAVLLILIFLVPLLVVVFC